MKQQERGISMAVREKKVRKYKDSDEKITARSLITPFVFSLPFMIGLLIFTVYPFIRAVLLSFMEDYRFLSGKFSGYGLGNYTAIFSDPNFINALKSTTKYVLIVVPTSLVISILVAVGLNNVKKLQGLFQTAYFLPMVTSATAVGMIFRWLYDYDYGLFNYFIGFLGIDKIHWLADVKYTMASICIYGIWSMLPFTIILLLAGLQNIDPIYYTAARADGAKSKDIFFNITIPLLAPTIILTSIVNVMSAFKVYDSLFVLYGAKPGPAFNLYTVIYYLYDQFWNKNKLGYAAASAMILFVIIALFTLLQNLITRKTNYYN
ncbi:MAG: sugar ABC transporter permease [Erysipelotrichaceae bacterium]|nr:sugar ABC transporter permease [Erysipelotrichaceae bacterium]